METPQNFDPMTGQPVEKKVDSNLNVEPQIIMPKDNDNSKIGLLVGIIAGVFAIIIAVLLVIYFKVINNGLAQISKAMVNTYDEYVDNNLLCQTFDIDNIVKDKEYTINADVNTKISSLGEVAISSEARVSDNIIQMDGDIDLSFIPAIEFMFQMDEQNVKAKTPLLDKYVFTYDYTKTNDGFLMKDVDSAEINSYLSTLYTSAFSGDANAEVEKRIKELLVNEIKNVKIKNTKALDYTVDGEAVKCKGFTMTISADSMKNIVNELNQVMDDYYSGINESVYNNMYIEAEDITEDTELSFYIYQKKISAIKMVYGSEVYECRFLGGDYRAQNLSITYNDKELLSVTGSKEGNSENIKYSIPEEEMELEYNYDLSNEELLVNLNYANDSYDFKFDIEKDKDELEVKMDYINFGDSYIGGKISISDGATLSNFESGEEFNVGDASEEEVNSLIDSIYSLILGLIGF